MSTPRPARPPGWQQEHMRRYIASGGQDGHLWEGVTTLLLTTTGRHPGQPRTTPLTYGRDGDRIKPERRARFPSSSSSASRSPKPLPPCGPNGGT